MSTEREQNLKEILFDKNNMDFIRLEQNGKELYFMQVYATVLRKQRFCVLIPTERIVGIDENTAIAFQIKKNQLFPVLDADIIEELNSKYAQVLLQKNFEDSNSVLKMREVLYVIRSSGEAFSRTKFGNDVQTINRLVKGLSAIKGQDAIIQRVIDYIINILHNDSSRGPKGCMYFIGAPCVGKTTLAELIASSLDMEFIRINMSEYSFKEAQLQAFGIHRSYKDAMLGRITNVVLEHPQGGILFFDEVDKAHPIVRNYFYQMLDGGMVQDAFLGKPVSYKNFIIIMASNSGEAIYNRSSDEYVFANLSQSVLVDTLREETDELFGGQKYSEALLSRFAMGRIFMFNKLTPANRKQVLCDKVRELCAEYQRKYKVSYDIKEEDVSELLMHNAGDVDLRVLVGHVESLFEKTFARGLQWAHEKHPNDIIRNISYRVNYNGADSEVRALMFADNKQGVCVSCDDFNCTPITEICKGFRVLKIDNNTSVKEIRKFDPSVSLICIDDADAQRRFEMLAEFRYATYVYSELEETTLSDFTPYSEKGAMGFYAPTLSKGQTLTEWVKNIVNSITFEDVISQLYRSNRLISFDEKYSYEADSGSLIISLCPKKINLGCNGKDSQGFVLPVDMPKVSFDDIIGLDSVKKELGSVARMLKSYKKYQREGITLPKGLLLSGSPGTAKTTLAKVLACESGLPFIALSGADFKHSLVGEQNKFIKKLFACARKHAPCIIFIDEIDQLLASREQRSHPEFNEDITTFLSEMEGFSDSDKPVFIIGATNYPVEGDQTMLDKAALRRFDKRVAVPLPKFEDRKKYLVRELKRHAINSVSDKLIYNLAKRSIGYSLADLHTIIENAIRLSETEEGFLLTDNILKEAFESFYSGDRKTYDEETVKQIAVHESGHAIISIMNGHCPDYITIESRGDAGGYVFNGEHEGKFGYCKDELLDEICCALAGRAAEVLIYQDRGISTGARVDIRHATTIAKRMICEYGMYDDFFMFIENDDSDNITLRVQKILQEQFQRAIHLLENNRAKIEKLSDVLLENESLMADEITKIITKE